MRRHYTKTNFSNIAMTVIALEVLSFITFVVVACVCVYNMFLEAPLFNMMEIILVITGAIIAAFILLAVAEFLQLLLKIEINTRKTEHILEAAEKDLKKATPKKKKTTKK